MEFILNQHRGRLLACLLLINALSLFPLLSSGFFADDILNSQIRGHMIQTDRSLWGVTFFYAKAWLIENGRLFPLAFYCYSVFYLLGNILFYKFFILSVILACISAFYFFLRRLTNSELIPLIAILLFPLIFQFRAGTDPILSFHASYPLISLMIFGSLNLFLRSLDEDLSLKLNWPAVLLFLCAGLIYEIVYPMFLMYFTVAYGRFNNVKAAARVAWPFLAVTSGLVLASLFFRSNATAIHSTYQMNLDVGVIAKTYLVQLFGSVPFSYFFLDPHSIFTNQIGNFSTFIGQFLLLVVMSAAFTVFSLSRYLSVDADRHKTTVQKGILMIGVLLLAIPSSMISLSSKHQAQSWGDAYLPVFMTCFGLSLLLAIGLARLHLQLTKIKNNRVWLMPVAAFIWLALFALNVRNNQLVVQTENETLWNSRVLLEDALSHGLLTGLSPKAVLLVSGVDPWDHADEYSAQTGMRFSVFRLNEVRDLTPVFQGAGGKCVPTTVYQQVCDFASDAPVYTVQIRHLSDGTGAVLLARVRSAYQAKGAIRGLLSNEVTAYFRLPPSAQPLTVALSGRSFQNETGGEIFRQSHELQLLKEGAGWKLVSLHGNITFDALSLRGEIAAERPESVILREKSLSAMELHAAGPVMLHVGYESGHIGNGLELPAIHFEKEMGIEVLVNPRNFQRSYADILSNHREDFRGLAIELVDARTNLYAASFGSGKDWMVIGNFTLIPGQRSHISIQLKDGLVNLYVNGYPISHTVLPAPIVQSPNSIFLGNWQGGDRSFQGWIEEVLISGRAKSKKMVLEDGVRLGTIDDFNSKSSSMLTN